MDCGTGYITALLYLLAKRVNTIEVISELTTKTLNPHNTNRHVGNRVQQPIDENPYDVIILIGSLPGLPKRLGEHLADNGKIFAVGCGKVTYYVSVINNLGRQRTGAGENFVRNRNPSFNLFTQTNRF